MEHYYSKGWMSKLNFTTKKEHFENGRNLCNTKVAIFVENGIKNVYFDVRNFKKYYLFEIQTDSWSQKLRMESKSPMLAAETQLPEPS